MKLNVLHLETLIVQNIRLFVLELCCWNRTIASDILGISPRTLNNYLKTIRDEGIVIPANNKQKPDYQNLIKELEVWLNFKKSYLLTQRYSIVEDCLNQHAGLKSKNIPAL
jgi:hypothetical protein